LFPTCFMCVRFRMRNSVFPHSDFLFFGPTRIYLQVTRNFHEMYPSGPILSSLAYCRWYGCSITTVFLSSAYSTLYKPFFLKLAPVPLPTPIAFWRFYCLLFCSRGFFLPRFSSLFPTAREFASFLPSPVFLPSGIFHHVDPLTPGLKSCRRCPQARPPNEKTLV